MIYILFTFDMLKHCKTILLLQVLAIEVLASW